MQISGKFVLKRPINNKPTLVHAVALRQIGDKPLAETMVV